MAEEKKEKLVKVSLKLRKRHPAKQFRLGSHVVGLTFKEFELNEKEVKELKTEGCRAWLISKKDYDEEMKKKPMGKPVKVIKDEK